MGKSGSATYCFLKILLIVDLKLVLFELVLRYLFVSPLAIALMVEGG